MLALARLSMGSLQVEFSNLREHQQKAVAMLRQGWKQYRSHLINASCGFGKTAVASYLCSQFQAAGVKTVFAAPYVSLVDQTYKRFGQYGMNDLSVIWQRDPRYNPHSTVQIASADTLVARGKKGDTIPEGTQVFIWDECDLRRKSLLEELQNRPEIKVIGLTATPYAKWLGQHYDNFIKPCTTNQLISEGWLTPFDISIPNVSESLGVMDGVGTKRDTSGEVDYIAGEAAAAMMQTKIVGNILANWLEHGQNLPTIGFAMNKDSANAYCREFLRAGVPAAVVVAETPIEERQIIYREFEQGIIKVLWNVGVLGAGFDSDVRCIIWAQPTKTERKWVQGTMRGSRPAKGKTECLLFDHTPSFFNLGYPNNIEYYALHDGSDGMEEARKQERKKREKDAQEKVCGNCGRVKAAGEYKCMGCGHKPLGGEAAECDESIGLVKADKTKKKQHTKEYKQKFYSELLGWQQNQRSRDKNVSDGRVAHIYKDKFGVWPRQLQNKAVEASPETRNFIKSRAIAYHNGKGKNENK